MTKAAAAFSSGIRRKDHPAGRKRSGLWDHRHKVIGVLKRMPEFIRTPIFRLMMTVYLLLNYLYDCRRFLKWSGASGHVKSRTTLQALIMIGCHRLEKGLALRQPRAGFGGETIHDLLANLKTYLNRYGADHTTRIALNVLLAYHQFSQAHKFTSPDLSEAIDHLKRTIGAEGLSDERGGTYLVTRQEIHASGMLDLREFFERRYSIRNFAEGEVDMDLIARAVRMAQKTPSVCNRQSVHVYVCSDPADKMMLLSHQRGSHGFGEQASKVLIVTSDMRHFVTVGERNQCWIDGGMFAMSLVYALHSLGLGTCCLNWCVDKFQDVALRQAVGLDRAEAILMMVAVGHLPDQLRVAQSPRKALGEVMIIK